MSRDDGFRVADLDVGFLDDPKLRALTRSTRDEAITARATLAYVATVLASWDHGERVTLEDAAPLWMTELGDLAERLHSVGLLDPDGTIPPKAWDTWYGTAVERREATRERWRRWNARRQQNPPSDRPSVPTVRPSVNANVGQTFANGGPPMDQPQRRRQRVNNGRTEPPELTTCPGCGDLVLEGEANVVVVDKLGRLGHRDCPGAPAS